MRTLEQYEFHIWRLLCFIEPRIEKDIRHKEVFLDITPEKRLENNKMRIHLIQTHNIASEHIKKEDINEFRLNLTKDTLSIKSINAHIITFRSWFKYLKKE